MVSQREVMVDVKIIPHKHCTVVKMDGRIDADSSPRLKHAFDSIMENGVFHIAFDMGSVDFISSAGLWALLDTQKACKRWNRGQLAIANPNERILNSLELAGMDHFFEIYDSVLDAVGHL